MPAKQVLLPFADGADPSPARHPFVAQLADLCREHPTRAKWVIVPSRGLGHALGDRLVREGTGWANLRFTTPLDLAIRMAGPYLLEQGLDPSEEDLGPALILRLAFGLPASHAYFRPMAEHTTMAAALWRAIRELRYAGFRARDLPAAAFESPAKHAELVALMAGYEHHLATRRVADMPAVFEAAPVHRAFCPVGDGDLLVEAPWVIWPPAVRGFLDTLPGTRVRPRAVDLPGLTTPARARRFAAPADASPTAAARDAARLRWLLVPTAAPPPRGDGSLDLFHAGGREAEIDEVLRRILASRRPLDEVEVICATDAQTRLVWEKALRLGWPVTVGVGLPVTLTRPGRAVLHWCDWVEGGFSAASLRRLLQSGDIRPSAFASAGDAPALSPGRAARVLLTAKATWGRATYGAALGALAEAERRLGARSETEGDEEGPGWHTERAMRAERLRVWAEDLLAAVPEPDASGTVGVAAVVDAARAFVDENAARSNDLDGAALLALRDALDELRGLGDHRCPPLVALRFVRERVESLAVGRDRARPGHLHVSALCDPGFDGRPLVFVCGLEEGRVFPATLEDPVLLDDERAAIGRTAGLADALASSTARLDEAVAAVVGRLAAAGVDSERVVLSFSCRDTREFRETFPSWLVLQAFRLVHGPPDADYRRLAGWLGDPVSAVPPAQDGAAAAAGWWLAGVRGNPRARGPVLSAFPWLARGERALAARRSDAFTAFDGLVQDAGACLDPSSNGMIVSATALEKAAACPFSYFLRRGLGVEELEESERDADVWLDPLTRGSELHDLYAEVMRRVRDEGRRLSRRRDGPWLQARGRERLDALREAMPPPSEEVFDREAAEFLEDLAGFVETEAGEATVEPVAFEVSFGYPRDDATEPLGIEEPVRVSLPGGRELRFRGRIDRINRVGDHEYEVVDYKTGRFYGPDWQGVFAAGTRLQHAVYGLAAERILRPHDGAARVVHATYWFPTGRGSGRRVTIPAGARARLGQVLSTLTEVIAAGTYAHPPDDEPCRFCNLARACGSDATQAARRKVEVDADGTLRAYTRLRTEE